MSKIEKGINWAKERRNTAGDDGDSSQRERSRLWTKRRMSEENIGAEWISKLRVEPVLDANSEESRVVLSENQEEVVRAAYKMLRTRTLQRMRSNAWQTLGVTSAMQGDGNNILWEYEEAFRSAPTGILKFKDRVKIYGEIGRPVGLR